MILQNKNKKSNHKIKLTHSQYSHAVQQTLNSLNKTINKKTVEEIARETKLIQRVSSKIFGYDFLVCMLIASLDAEHATLEKMADIFSSLNHRIRIRPQSIMERLNDETAPFFF